MADTKFKAGELWKGNKNGRPKGSKSLKTYVKEMLQDMNEEERLEFLEGIDKKVLWEMSEGKPAQDMNVAGKDGNPIIFTIAKEIAEKNDITPEPESNSTGQA